MMTGRFFASTQPPVGEVFSTRLQMALDPAGIPAYINGMQDVPELDQPTVDAPSTRNAPVSRRSWVIGASVLLHVLIVVPFIVNLSLPVHEKPQEEVVSVEMVPPPEPEPPPEPAPQPPPPEPAAPPEPPPPPSPPPPKTPEPQKAAAPIPTLRPVFRFGEETRGPQQAVDGDSADRASQAPVTEPEPPVPPQPAISEAQAKQLEAAAAQETPPSDTPDAAETAPPPAAEKTADEAQALAVLGVPAADGHVAAENAQPAVSLPQQVAKPLPRPAAVAASEGSGRPKPDLKEAKKLYSASRTGAEVAMTAMAGIPRGERAGQLCASELQAQLLNGSPPMRPELVPAYTLAPGTSALDVGRGAFRAGGAWYDVSFRCSVNAEATEIESFSFAIGPRVPRNEWRARGFPSF